jgi:cysteinyl-tRNA synthetase
MTLDLINQIHAAWQAHVQENVARGLPKADRPIEGDEEKVWPRLGELNRDKAWRLECVRRDEKFDMHFSSAVRLCR